MKYAYPIEVLDRNSVLLESEKRQLKTSIGLRLFPIAGDVERVVFQIKRRDHYRYRSEYMVHSSVKLNSGKVIKSVNTGFQKAALLMLSVTQIQELAESRIGFESSWLYRASGQLKSCLSKFVGRKTIGFENRKASSAGALN